MGLMLALKSEIRLALRLGHLLVLSEMGSFRLWLENLIATQLESALALR
jgi:hypothetical protein